MHEGKFIKENDSLGLRAQVFGRIICTKIKVTKNNGEREEDFIVGK